MKTFSKNYVIPNRLIKMAGNCYLFDRSSFMETELSMLSEYEKTVVFLTLAELIGDTSLDRFKHNLFERVKINCYSLFNYEPEHYDNLLKKYKEFKVLNLRIPESYKISLINLKLKFQDLNLILDFFDIYNLYRAGVRFKISNCKIMNWELPRIRTKFVFYYGDYEFLNIAYVESRTCPKLMVIDSEIKSERFKVLMRNAFQNWMRDENFQNKQFFI